MPDLGKYAAEVGLAYAVSLILLAGLVAFFWWRSTVVKKRLHEVEKRTKSASGQGG